MRRDVTPLKLRPIDEEAEQAEPVIRLSNEPTGEQNVHTPLVRLVPHDDEDDTSTRLDLPAIAAAELRSHQPGIEEIIDAGAFNTENIEQNWGEQAEYRNPIPWGWFALLGLLVGGSAFWSLTQVEKADEKAVEIRSTSDTVMMDDAREEREALVMIEKIEKCLRRFFLATTVEELARTARFSERVLPLMRKYYANQPVFSSRMRSVHVLQPLTLDHRGDFWMASVMLADGQNKNLIIEITENGEPRIDWETMVCDQPMKWDDYVQQRPSEVSLDFRVYVQKDNFFSHEFRDSDHWQCFRLTVQDGEETLFGYMEKDNPASKELLQAIEMNAGAQAAMILRLRIPQGIQSRRGVIIEKMVNSRWLYLDAPNSGS